MKPVQIQIPPGAEMVNYLYPAMDLDDLTQDLVTVRLSNGYCIDVGWYPEHDPSGRFVIRVFHEYWDGQKQNPAFAKDVASLVPIVEKLASWYSQDIVPTSRFGSVLRQEKTFA